MRYFLLCLIFSISSISVKAQSFAWAKRAGSSGASVTTPNWDKGLCIDGSGNVYTISTFTGNVDFDPGPGTFTLNSNNGSNIIQKLDAAGNLLWAKQYSIAAQSIAVDGGGTIYLTGNFTGTADFDLGSGVYNLTALGQDVFIIKLSAEGNFLWAKQVGGTLGESSSCINVSTSGNIYIGGSFGAENSTTSYTADFNSDPSVSNELTTVGGRDGFILSLNSSGEFLWVRQKGTINTDAIACIAIDGNENIIYAGLSKYYNYFIEKVDLSNNLLWTTNLISGVQIFSISTDPNRNILVSGNFSGTVDFNPGTGVKNYTASSSQDGFLEKFDDNGNFLWAVHIRSNGTANSIAADASGNVYTAGHFGGNGNVDFDPGPGTFNLKASTRATYIQKLNANGNFIWVKQIAGDNKSRTFAKGIVVNTNGDIYTNFEFSGTIDVDPGTAKVSLTSFASLNSWDKVIHKVTQANSGFREAFVEADKKEELMISTYSPNRFMVKLPGVNENVILTIYDMSGRIISKKNVTAGTQQSINLPAINGVYTLEAKYKDRVLIKRIPVQEQGRTNLL